MKRIRLNGSFISQKLPKMALGLVFALIALTTFAQDISVKGTVSDKSNSGIAGVAVKIKGTTRGTSTDATGNYKLSVGNNATLVFSAIGYGTKEISVSNKTTIDITLDDEVQNLGEVVVTALGIKKDAKKLGYSVSSITREALTENRTPNFMNALQGQIAGVNISPLGTGPAGTSKIRIRGQSSISGQNSPLIVVNGIPIDNTNFGTNPGNAASDNSIGVRGGGNTSDGGDGLSSINPDDIENMTVLKGATAAALYGSRAKDGVIMITTKTKGDSKGIGVTYNTNFTNDTPLDFTDYQYVYGQGENGVRPTTANPTSGQWSFGEKFQPGMTQVLFDGVTVPYEPVYNRISKFFRNGTNFTNTIALSSSSEKGGFTMSLANMDNKGIVPNNTFNRKTINLGIAYDLSSKLSVAGNINYSNETNKNPPNIANQDNSIPTAVYNMANSMPFDLLEAKKFDASGNEFVYSRFRNRTNPYFTLSQQFQNIVRDRIFGNITLKYKLLDWLSVQGRVGQDFWTRDQDYNNFPTGQASLGPAPAGFVNGIYTQESRKLRETNADILITASKTFGDFGFDLNLGGNQLYRREELNSTQVTDFVVRDLYTVMNGRVKDPIYGLAERGVNSLYGAAEFSYMNTLFISVTARNDWFSTLSKENRSILYPSISGSYVFSQSFSSLPSWLSFGKLRAAYAEVGTDGAVPPYSNNLFYGVNANLFGNPSGTLQPIGGSLGLTIPNTNLRPSRTSESEFGVELKLFQNRVSLDITGYHKVTKDQIASAQVSDASGFTNTLINSGISQNNGIEMLLSFSPIKTKDFQWNLTLNNSYNITKVLSLTTDDDGTPEKDYNKDGKPERFTSGTHVFNGELRQIVGQEIGQIYGFGFKRNDAGQMIFGANGIPLRTNDLISYGSALPKWTGGITNSFNYKGLSFSFLIDFKLGNMMLSGTNFNAVRHGLHQMTLDGREGGVVGVGVTEKGEPNTVKAPVQDYWSVVRSLAIVEPVVYDGGYWKLRQITIGYELSKFLPKNFPVKGLKLSLTANNVLMLKKWVPNIDPDSFGYSSDNLVGMESTGLPSTRSIGFNLNAKF
jgi:TonB-linked SusC/RagA family outer membrane protein